MSEQWPGGFVTKNPPVPSGPYETDTAQGLWTLSQQAGYRKQDLWPTQGNVNPDAFIENLFSTYLYTGNSSTQTITNGIDLAGKGGLVWLKGRSLAVGHYLYDTNRGIANGPLSSENTNAAYTANTPKTLTSFNSNGFSMQDDSATFGANVSPRTQVSWTFREQPKFFDVVTYTGDGVQPRAIAHSLGSTPGCVIVKNTSAGGGWYVYHVGANAPGYTAAESYTLLNSTNAVTDNAFIWGNTAPSSTTFTVSTQLNANGNSYVAYLFAHDAGGFGLSGNENVVSCGSYTGNGSATGPVVTLGYEPQWVMIKRTSGAGNWVMLDVMRGFSDSSDNELYADLNLAEGSGLNLATPLATGFQLQSSTGNLNASGQTYIYIAIRRGPMAVPTLGTSVFAPVVRTGTNAVASITGLGFAPDSALIKFRTAAVDNVWYDRLRGPNLYLSADNTNPEVSYSPSVTSYNNTGITFGDDLAQGVVNANGVSYINYLFGRAPSFFDEVCYTGTGGASQTFTHNLGVAPELVIVKNRDAAAAWESLGTALSASQRQIYLNRTQAGVAVASGHLGWNGTDGAYKAPTSSVVYFGGDSDVGGSGVKYVAYLFATCAGVSKVGSYTGTGTTQAIACGFTTGARFVMIKRTDAVGDWYVWDSARGIVAGNDPYLLINDAAAEVTSTDYIDTSAAGFEITSTAPAAINAVGGSYIFLAIS